MADDCAHLIAGRDEPPFFLYFAPDEPHRSNTARPDGSPAFDTSPRANSFGNRTRGFPGIMPLMLQPEEVRVPSFLPDIPATRAEPAGHYRRSRGSTRESGASPALRRVCQHPILPAFANFEAARLNG
jgi:N-sulfoglucosamine sulfohydrolase